tara:strand:+ start:1072 stop:1332 length:261 start_codon:yes stop_codon:yes gene_type:complete
MKIGTFLEAMIEGCELQISTPHGDDVSSELGSDYDPKLHYFAATLTLNGQPFWAVDQCAEKASRKAFMKGVFSGAIELEDGEGSET